MIQAHKHFSPSQPALHLTTDNITCDLELLLNPGVQRIELASVDINKGTVPVAYVLAEIASQPALKAHRVQQAILYGYASGLLSLTTQNTKTGPRYYFKLRHRSLQYPGAEDSFRTPITFSLLSSRGHTRLHPAHRLYSALDLDHTRGTVFISFHIIPDTEAYVTITPLTLSGLACRARCDMYDVAAAACQRGNAAPSYCQINRRLCRELRTYGNRSLDPRRIAHDR